MKENKSFFTDTALKAALKVPGTRIDREEFLRKVFKKYYPSDTLNKIVESNPILAGVDNLIIDKIANQIINEEVRKSSGLSFLAGIPGGATMLATIPADASQYYIHTLKLVQKLIYIYGWSDLYDENGNIDNDGKKLLLIFLGSMYGVKGATSFIKKISTEVAENIFYKITESAITTKTSFKIASKIIGFTTGKELTQTGLAKVVSKSIPIVGGMVSGGITYITLKKLSNKFRNHIKDLPMNSVEFYNQLALEYKKKEELK